MRIAVEGDVRVHLMPEGEETILRQECHIPTASTGSVHCNPSASLSRELSASSHLLSTGRVLGSPYEDEG